MTLLATSLNFHRRAKLKRLTTEDQERMMTSRALPEDFDFSQTLRHSHGEEISPFVRHVSFRHASDDPESQQSGEGSQADLSNISHTFSTNPTYSQPSESVPANPLSYLSPNAPIYNGFRSSYFSPGAPTTMATESVSPYSYLSYNSTGAQVSAQVLRLPDQDSVAAKALHSPPIHHGPRSISDLSRKNPGFLGESRPYTGREAPDIVNTANMQSASPYTRLVQVPRSNEPAGSPDGLPFYHEYHTLGACRAPRIDHNERIDEAGRVMHTQSIQSGFQAPVGLSS